MVSALSGSISNSTESWWINSGATKHITRFKKALADYKAKKFNVKVELGDGSTYAIKGVDSICLHLDLGMLICVEEIMYVLGLKKKILSILVLEYKGFNVIFMDNKALLCPKNTNINFVVRIPKMVILHLNMEWMLILNNLVILQNLIE